MYRFSLGDTKVECDTADEVRAVVNGRGNGHSNGTKRGRKKRPAGNPVAINVDDLPLIEGPVDWKTIKKVAKTIGFDGDLRALRTAIVAKRQQNKA